MTWPLDKLTLINQQLSLTGNNLVNTAEDGSNEWQVCSDAYEAALPYMLENGDWKFGTLVATLTHAGDSSDPLYDDAYAKPQDCLHLIWVRLNDRPTDYQILNNQVAINAGGGIVTAKYVRQPGPEQVTPTFMQALGLFIRAGIYRGLHEDGVAADREEAKAEALLQRARTRADQEQPKRAAFNSRLSAARRVRRPWMPTPRGWTGTGNPT